MAHRSIEMLAYLYYTQLERDIIKLSYSILSKELKVYISLPAADHQIKRLVSLDNWSLECLQRNII